MDFPAESLQSPRSSPGSSLASESSTNISRYIEILGGGTSAKELADGLAKVETLDIQSMHDAAHVSNLDFFLQPDSEVYENLHRSTKIGKAFVQLGQSVLDMKVNNG